MYEKIILSKEAVRQFAFDIFDVLIQDIKDEEARKQKTLTETNFKICRCCCMREWVA
jgi:hypothetical protein